MLTDIPGPWKSGFPAGSVVKNPPANGRDVGLIPGSGRSPGGGNGNPLQYFLPGESRGQRKVEGYSPWGCKRVGQDLAPKQLLLGTVLLLHYV